MSNPILDVRNVEVFNNGSLSNEDYHAREGISSTGVLTIASDCPAVYKYAERKPSKAMDFGTASHALMLEPEMFAAQFVRDISKNDYDAILSTQAEVKAWLKDAGIKGYSTKPIAELYEMVFASDPDVKILATEIEKHHKKFDGATFIKADDYDTLLKMHNAIFAYPAYAKVLRESSVECSVFCEIKIEGCDDWIKVKVRPDIITKDLLVPDYKTTRDVRPEEFGRLAYYSGYWTRQAFVCDILSAVYKKDFKPSLLAQGSSSPYIPQMYMLNSDQVGHGRSEYHESLITYSNCLKTDVWPAYSDGPIELETPGYLNKQLFD
tara:strand:- start:7804 stop:8769 length:966 start_codon:yes stop_codon:yes gene_type:complete